jgi:putative restriction endonuclease
MPDRVFGDIPGVPIGAMFNNRQELSVAGVHRPTMAGISGAASEGADSIVVSGGYEDDEDYGDVIIYTGHGGNDPNTGKQIADQELTYGNLALAKSSIDGLPVRVVRGARGDPHYAPASGYRYDGLYFIERYWQQIGRSGHRVWQFRLHRRPSEGDLDSEVDVTPMALGPAPRLTVQVQRLIRNTAAAQVVKQLHDYACQVCGVRLVTPAGPYAEGAHIQPLGRPHDGPDVSENILCLCPNDHIRFDDGGLCVLESLDVVDMDGALIGRLRTVPSHRIGHEFLAYHRALITRR